MGEESDNADSQKIAKIIEQYVLLLTVPFKVYTRITERRIRWFIEHKLGDEQAVFRKGKGALDNIFVPNIY